jgi:hypothetical protein
MLGWMAMPSVLTVQRLARFSVASTQETILVEATIDAVGPNMDAKYAASRPPVSTVVVIGKWTVAGCAGWLIVAIKGG